MKEYLSGSFMVKVDVIFSMDSKVVHVDLKPFFMYHVSKNMVHECLEGWRCIGEPEKHDHGFKKSFRSNEHSFPLVFLLNSNVVVFPVDVELGEQGGILHIID